MCLDDASRLTSASRLLVAILPPPSAASQPSGDAPLRRTAGHLFPPEQHAQKHGSTARYTAGTVASGSRGLNRRGTTQLGSRLDPPPPPLHPPPWQQQQQEQEQRRRACCIPGRLQRTAGE